MAREKENSLFVPETETWTCGRASMGVISRFKEWRVLQSVKPNEELADVVGGREGEGLLRQLVGSSYAFKDAQLLSGRRIPSRDQGRRREIDLIVCTPKQIHLIEVKNWSGRLDVQGGSWRQTRRSGEVVDHGNLLESNRAKRDAVVEYLQDRGLKLDERTIQAHLSPQIIFTNPNLEIAPEIEARADVISHRELDGYLGKHPKRKGLAESMFSSLIELCLDRDSRRAGGEGAGHPLPREPYRQIVLYLEEAGTWDQLRYFGGRTISGDLVSMRVGGKTYRSAEIRELARAKPIRLKWTRNRFWGLFLVLTGLGSFGRLHLGGTRLSLSVEDTLFFHAVGEREARSHKLREFQEIHPGY